MLPNLDGLFLGFADTNVGVQLRNFGELPQEPEFGVTALLGDVIQPLSDSLAFPGRVLPMMIAIFSMPSSFTRD